MYVHHIDPVLVFRSAGRIGGVTLLQCRRTRARYQSASGAFFTGSDWHGPALNLIRAMVRELQSVCRPYGVSASHGIHGQAGAPVVIRPVIM
jgi:hypothetical protein